MSLAKIYPKLLNSITLPRYPRKTYKRKDFVPMRFVQYLRKHDRRKHLGVASHDGKSLVPLDLGSCCSNDMITFIRQRMTPEEIIAKIRRLPAEPVTSSMILLPPVTNPEKIICIGRNYPDRCKEQKQPIPNEPVFYCKYASSLVGPTANVIAHPISKKIDWEAELAVVIGKTARNVSKERALDYVFGYTIAQDISARDWSSEANSGQLLIAKTMDTFCPLGPAIAHKNVIEDPHNLNITARVNGVEKQIGNTGNMIFKISDIIHRLTKTITLKPGDLILTGTPSGVGAQRSPPEYLKPGDVIESEIQSIGTLINKVV